ncbi:hypothetical protein AB6D11_14350 [Vibrio splendidus]
MELPRNSVWSVHDSDLIEDGLYRLLDVMLEVDSIVLYPLSDMSTTAKPIATSLDGFIELTSNHQAKISQYALPSYLLVDEDSVPETYIAKRDKNFELIKGLIVDREFLFDYATRQRSSYLTRHAKKVGTYSKALARLLSLYWRNGQEKMALLPAFQEVEVQGYRKLQQPYHWEHQNNQEQWLSIELRSILSVMMTKTNSKKR